MTHIKVKKITRNVAIEHTWDVSTNTETYNILVTRAGDF